MRNMHPFPWQKIVQYSITSERNSLPWRNYDYPTDILIYRVWISEILLQQTQAERVVPFFENIITRFPTVFNLAEATYDEFFPYYQGMGYYSRARNILKTAHIIANDFGGYFPAEKSLLKALPGIGEYTSSAILAFGYGKTFLAWDTNLEKVFARFYTGNSREKLSKQTKQAIEDDFQKFLENLSKENHKNTVRSINNGLMDLARLIETKNPAQIDWVNYPLKESVFYKTRWALDVKKSTKTSSFPIPDATILAILYENHKTYFSSEKWKYTPFLIPPALTRETRKTVQEYFLKHFGLSVSVRPIHKKWLTTDDQPFVAVNVQIQTGIQNFEKFNKKDTTKVLTIWYEK